MRLTQDVHLVGGGDYGFGLTHRLDCHTYVIDGGSELALIDTGFAEDPHEIVALIREDGLDPADIGTIVITHYHADHAGGAARMRELTGAKVWAGTEAAPFIRAGDADQIGLNWAKQFGFYPADYTWNPCEVDGEFEDGTRIRVGELELELIATPGHCMGHYCVRMVGRDRTYMFTSDCVFWGGAIILQNVKDSSLQQYAESCNRLAALEWDAMLPGHHVISLKNGHRHAETAANEFNRIGMPKDLLR